MFSRKENQKKYTKLVINFPLKKYMIFLHPVLTTGCEIGEREIGRGDRERSTSRDSNSETQNTEVAETFISVC